MKTVETIRSETTFAFPVADLLATYNAASKDKTRYYLQGVYVEPREEGVRLVATNGHILIRTDSEGFGPSKPIILSVDTMEKALKTKGNNPWVYGDIETGIIHVVEWCGENTPCPRLGVCEFSIVDGSFPDYTRVIPESRSGADYFSFDPNLLGTLHKAGSVFGKEYAMRITAENNTSPMLVEYSNAPHMIGVLMPRRWK